MKFKRLFSSEGYKGEKNYLNNQKTYEIIRTVLMFSLSAAVYLIGYLTTHTNKNLLTVVAVLGTLPAAKSTVNMIMFLRYRSCDKELADRFEAASKGVLCAYDRVFTSYEKNFVIDHLCVRGGSIIGYAPKPAKKDFSENDFIKHLNTYLSAEKYTDVVIKIFNDPEKYLERLKSLSETPLKGNEEGIMNVLLSISL